MQIDRFLTGSLQGLVVSLRPLRSTGEKGAYDVRITQHGMGVKYIFWFPADRAQVLNAVLREIGKRKNEIVDCRG